MSAFHAMVSSLCYTLAGTAASSARDMSLEALYNAGVSWLGMVSQRQPLNGTHNELWLAATCFHMSYCHSHTSTGVGHGYHAW